MAKAFYDLMSRIFGGTAGCSSIGRVPRLERGS